MKTKLQNLIICGECTPEDDYMDILLSAAKEHPINLVDVIFEASKKSSYAMIIPGLAALLSGSPISIINGSKPEIIDLLKVFSPTELLLLTELIKSKVFGRGLGSSPQKLIREVIEKWSAEELQAYVITEPKKLHNLIKLIHPRYAGAKAEMIKKLIK